VLYTLILRQAVPCFQRVSSGLPYKPSFKSCISGNISYYGRDFQCTCISGWFVNIYYGHAEFHWVFVDDTNEKSIQIIHLREQYRCTCFRILVIGRANAGKTTILEKVCGVGKGTVPIIIHDKEGKLLDESSIYKFLILCSF
jgi:hypothetical protein